MKKLISIVVFIFVFSFTFGQTKSLQYKDVKRKYILYTPQNYDSAKTYPVVFNFHGGGMTPAEQMLYTDMNQTADKYGFIVVYPKGIKEDWNVGFETSYKEGTDDIGFVDALLTQLQKDYKIDNKRVFATGLSRGGFFCYRIAAELSHRFTAVAAIGATLPDSVAINNPNKKETGVLIVHGKADKIVNFEGKKDAYFSAVDTYKYWKMPSFTREIKKTINKVPHDDTTIEILESSSTNKTVTLISIENGGHTWPGANDFNIGLPIGKTSKELDINEYMWAFFEKQK